VKELLQEKQGRLYAAAAMRSRGEVFDVTRTSLDQSYEGWLLAMKATEELNMSAQAALISNDLRRPHELKQKPALQLCQPIEARQIDPGPHSSKLTTQEYVQVMMATIREGRQHARWPREVIEHFLAAEVIVSKEQ
jgi:hypothetical protein